MMSKFVSEKQIIANRINAKKGGVKTPEGKEISKMNALTFGVYSPVLIDSEERKNYNLLVFDFTEEYSPQGISEENLVHQIALYEIKLRRVSWMEEHYNAMASLNSIIQTRESLNLNETSSDLVIYLHDYLIDNKNVLKVANLGALEKIQKYREMLENRREKCLNELMRIKYFKRNYV